MGEFFVSLRLNLLVCINTKTRFNRNVSLVFFVLFTNYGHSLLHDGQRQINLYEIQFKPFGYLMTLGEDPPIDMYEITYFNNYGYNDKYTLNTQIPYIESNHFLSGIYKN